MPLTDKDDKDEYGVPAGVSHSRFMVITAALIALARAPAIDLCASVLQRPPAIWTLASARAC